MAGMPHIRPAGKSSDLADESVLECLQPPTTGRPITPPEQARYRKSTTHASGKIVRHPGFYDDSFDLPGDEAHGVKTKGVAAESMAEVIKNYPESQIMQWRRERQEDIYHSSKLEPLGKPMPHNYKIPEGLGTERPFGRSIGAKEMMSKPKAKQLIFPVDTYTEDTAEQTAMYLKSHSSFQPGEQRNRKYDWDKAGIDPTQFKFGVTHAEDYVDGVAKALNPTKEEDYRESVSIVPERLERFKLTAKDELGKCRSMGWGNRNIPDGFAFGKPGRDPNDPEWGARKVMVGEYTEEELKPDADLGKAIRPGFRNMAPPERVFGLPSVRVDIARRYPQPSTTQVKAGMTCVPEKGVADNMNYGEEPDAVSLIFPGPHADRGVTEAMYLQPYTPEKLKAFLEGAGVSTEGFDEYFAHAADVDNFPGGNQASIVTYRKVKRHFETQALGL